MVTHRGFRYRSRSARRKAKKRHMPYTAKNNITRSMPGFPTNNIVKLRYVDIIELSPGTATLGNYQYRANSIFDTDLTGVGHQPIGRDQWAEFYNHYLVSGSKITCNFVYDDPNTNANMVYGVYLSDDPTLHTNAIDICENGLGRWGTMAAVNYAPVAGTSSSNSPTIRNYYSARKFFNVADVSDNVNRFGAYFGTNPSDTAIYTIWCGAMDPLLDLGTVRVMVTIEYTVRLSEPKALPRS